MDIIFTEQSKPILSPTGLFLTELSPEDHCETEMLDTEPTILIDHWKRLIELSATNKLACT